MNRTLGLVAAAFLTSACVGGPLAAAQAAPTSHSGGMMTMNHNSIQPETTLSLTGTGSVDRAPDMAQISVGVSVDAETAAAAMTQQAARMTSVFATLKQAGITERDIQTANLTLNPVYDYNTNGQRPRLTGYNVSNEVRITVRDISKLGKALDAVVKAGGNTINGISFGLSTAPEALKEARAIAMKDAVERANLYASAAGYRVRRIVSITEQVNYEPMPVMATMRMADAAESAPTPVAGGEVKTSASVNVLFELEK